MMCRSLLNCRSAVGRLEWNFDLNNEFLACTIALFGAVEFGQVEKARAILQDNQLDMNRWVSSLLVILLVLASFRALLNVRCCNSISSIFFQIYISIGFS